MIKQLEELEKFIPNKQEIKWSSVLDNQNYKNEETPKIMAQCCKPGPCSPKWSD